MFIEISLMILPLLGMFLLGWVAYSFLKETIEQGGTATLIGAICIIVLLVALVFLMISILVREVPVE